jgi:hypothetical protein
MLNFAERTGKRCCHVGMVVPVKYIMESLHYGCGSTPDIHHDADLPQPHKNITHSAINYCVATGIKELECINSGGTRPVTSLAHQRGNTRPRSSTAYAVPLNFRVRSTFFSLFSSGQSLVASWKGG